MYGVNLNVLAERRAALHFKATRLQARAVDAASILYFYYVSIYKYMP